MQFVGTLTGTVSIFQKCTHEIVQTYTIMKQLFVNFYQKKFRKKKDGTAPIYLRFTLDGHRCDISLGASIDPQKWDEDKGRAKGTSRDANRINMTLQAAHGKLIKLHTDNVMDGSLSARDLKDKFLGKKDEAKAITLLNAFDNHIKRVEEKVAIGARSESIKRTPLSPDRSIACFALIGGI